MDITFNHKKDIRGRKDRLIQPVYGFIDGVLGFVKIVNAGTGKDITHKFDIEIKESE